MKKAFLLGCMISLLSFAQAKDTVDLLYGFDFNNSFNGTFNNDVNIADSPGPTSVSNSGAYSNWFPNENNNTQPMDGSTKAYNANGGYYIISDTNGIGLNTAQGFTLTLNINLNNQTWADIFSLTVGGAQYKLETGGNETGYTKLHVYAPVEGSSDVSAVFDTSDTLSINTWINLALTVQGSTYTLMGFDSNGDLLKKWTFTGAEGDVTLIQGNGAFSGHTCTLYIDNIGIYDGALTEEELSGLVQYEMEHQTLVQSFDRSTPAVPEPATATLSLLALCGLAARRRRK